jgi:hypothetical protein
LSYRDHQRRQDIPIRREPHIPNEVSKLAHTGYVEMPDIQQTGQIDRSHRWPILNFLSGHQYQHYQTQNEQHPSPRISQRNIRVASPVIHPPAHLSALLRK